MGWHGMKYSTQKKKKKHPSLRLEIVASPVDPLLVAPLGRDQSLRAIQLEAETTPNSVEWKMCSSKPGFSREIHGKPSNRAPNYDKNVTWKMWKQVKPCTAWHLEWISMTSLQIVGYRCLPCTVQYCAAIAARADRTRLGMTRYPGLNCLRSP